MEMAVAVGVTACFAVLRHAVRCAALRMARKEKMQEEQSQCPKPPRKTWQRSVPTKKMLVSEMIALYCRKQHHTLRGSLCPECQQLHDYALARIEHCPFMETKTFCSACKVHCYQPEMREKIRTVMRWAGPRMLPVHPVLSIKHVIVTMKARREANAGK